MNKKAGAMFSLVAAGLILILGSVNPCSAQVQKAPPPELVQYVKDAAKLGLNDSQIQQNATKAGWPTSIVNDAIAYVRISNQTAEAVAKAPAQRAATTPLAGSAPLAADIPATRTAIRPVDTAPTSKPSDAADRTPANDYQIGAGDVLHISVWREPEASAPSAVVRPDGKIGLPLLKEVEVAGLTPKQAEDVIAERLSKYIPGADVTVVVAGINSKKIYIIGAVKREGPISYTYRMTIMQALSEAGGLSDYAKRKKIYVLRAENGKQHRLPFDYEAVLRGERMELNILLLPNDTLVVPY